MLTESEVIRSRYSDKVTEVDALGRIISVRRLRPSEESKLQEMTPDLSGSSEATNAEGEKVQVSHRLPLYIAASVCQIDQSPIPFPRSKGELYAIYDRLDREGMLAAGKAIAAMNEQSPIVTDGLEQAKNL